MQRDDGKVKLTHMFTAAQLSESVFFFFLSSTGIGVCVCVYLRQQVDERLQKADPQILQVLWWFHFLGVGKEHVFLQGEKRKNHWKKMLL